MKLFKRFKSDKKFRTNLIIGIIIAIIVANYLGFDEKKEATGTPQSTCDLFNDGVYIDGVDGAFGCVNNNCVVLFYDPNPPLGDYGPVSGWVVGCLQAAASVFPNEAVCINTGSQSQTFIANSLTVAHDACGRGTTGFKAIETGNHFCGKKYYLCAPDTNGDGGACKDWQKPFAEIWTAVFKDSNLRCSTQAYLVLGIGGALILAVV